MSAKSFCKECGRLFEDITKEVEQCFDCSMRETNSSFKECKIINSKFSWILNVDGEEIAFQGGHNVDYFKKHYESLGYVVEIVQ